MSWWRGQSRSEFAASRARSMEFPPPAVDVLPARASAPSMGELVDALLDSLPGRPALVTLRRDRSVSFMGGFGVFGELPGSPASVRVVRCVSLVELLSPLFEDFPELGEACAALEGGLVVAVAGGPRSDLLAELRVRGLRVAGDAMGDADDVRAALDLPELAGAVQSGLVRAVSGLRASCGSAVSAALGAGSAISRDVWESSVSRLSRRESDLLVWPDRRVCRVDLVAEVALQASSGDPVGLVLRVSAEDLGVPERVEIQGSKVTVRLSSRVQQEVHAQLDGRRQVVGYRSVPRELVLGDPLGVSFVLSLVEAGGAAVVEQVGG